MKDKFFYFRTEDVAANDQNQATSLNIPVSKITGMQALDGNTITIYFESKLNDLGESEFGDQHFQNSSVILNITNGARKVVMKAIAEASNAEPHDDGIIVIADDLTKKYIHKHITSVGAISTTSQIGSDIDDA
mgnify:CR=1 FL=1|tara:strand:+ start:3266 stop:3664 length:399 start_codon:yes stop_codon:yes gene_type:complete